MIDNMIWAARIALLGTHSQGEVDWNKNRPSRCFT